MPFIRDILNEIKFTKDLSKIKIYYIHRGAIDNTKLIIGTQINQIKRSYIETDTSTIPYHRIFKITYDGKTIFDRKNL